MEDSMAHPGGGATLLESPAWKALAGFVSGALLALTFLVAGVWKVTDPLAAAARMTQALIPDFLSLPVAIAAGIAEIFAAVLLVVPRYRRWGAWLAGLMLVAFLVYFAVFYGRLRGEECNCFPWVRRVVGPAFFIGDAIMLGLAAAAGWWASPSRGRRGAAIILAAVGVFALVSYGAQVAREHGAAAPNHISVDGRPVPLAYGRVFLYFFDPECSHCDAAARSMARYDWKDTRVIVVPVAQPQFAAQFLKDTGLRAGISSDVDKLKAAFAVRSSPFGIAVEHGRQKAAIAGFDPPEPADTLRRVGFIE